jgi:hypothetical protein
MLWVVILFDWTGKFVNKNHKSNFLFNGRNSILSLIQNKKQLASKLRNVPT